MIRVLLTGGGSGGHIFPLLAVAKELQKKSDVQLRYFGPKSIYTDYLTAAGIKIAPIASAKLRRYFSWHNFIDAFKLIWSIFQAVFKVYWYMPDVAFSKGGSGSLPVLLACWFYRIPIVIHESDSVPSLNTLLARRFAKKALFAFKGIGNPIRDNIIRFTSYDPQIMKSRLGLQKEKPLILILGGSLGAVRINNFIEEVLDMLLERAQIVHQVGTANFAEMNKIKRPGYHIYAFLEGETYGQMLAASDIVISRAGAGAIFEIAAFGKPSILIPLPESAGEHQKHNAYYYADTGAAVVIEENNLLPHIFLREIDKILKDNQYRQSMQKVALSFAKPDAAPKIVQEIIKTI